MCNFFVCCRRLISPKMFCLFLYICITTLAYKNFYRINIHQCKNFMSYFKIKKKKFTISLIVLVYYYSRHTTNQKVNIDFVLLYILKNSLENLFRFFMRFWSELWSLYQPRNIKQYKLTILLLFYEQRKFNLTLTNRFLFQIYIQVFYTLWK